MQQKLMSFDLGTNSIGFCVYQLGKNDQPERLIDIGTRIFSDGRDPKLKTSLAVARREARSAARRRDRYLARRKALLQTLIDYGLMPADKSAQEALLRETSDHKKKSGKDSDNPYALRARALDEELPPAYIGRILFHLNQRRGFKSNRKTDRKDNDKGKIATGIDELKAKMHLEGARTYGEWLAKRYEKEEVVRLRADSEVVSKEGYAFYPERSFLYDEFRKIWNRQAQYHPTLLTPERRDHLFAIMFYQRPLKKPKVGKCAFNPLEERVAKANPLFQEFRLYKEINELELVDQWQQHTKLDIDQRNALFKYMRTKKEAKFESMRKFLKLPQEISFNKESDSRKSMKGDEVYSQLANKKRFGQQWSGFDRDEQWTIVQVLKEEEDPARLYAWLKEEYNVDGEQAEEIANCPLPDGYGRLGETALSSMLDEMQLAVIPESEAAKNYGYDHSRLGFESEDGEDFLPPYQEILERHIPPGSGDPDDIYDIYKGRITNPTVHIGLNQLRRLINGLIKKHGKPKYIALELARDLQLSEQQKRDINRTIAQNTRDAEARSKKLIEMDQPDTGYNRLLLKLWEELNPGDLLNRCCIYTGLPISISMLFSAEVDIDHILPWSKTLDDSQANKILCLRSANRQKRNRAPAQVAEWQDNYDDILARAARLPKNKRWRFAKDAMEKFEAESGFLARQLTDTQYLSRLAKEYLECLYPSEEPDRDSVLKKRNHVWVTPGRLTEMLRRNWGLNSLLPDHNLGQTAQVKNRKDHRHHAIDAAVIGVTTRSLLQRLSTAAGRMEEGEFDDLVKKMVSENPPWPTFRADLQEAISKITVSHKPDHGTVSRKGYAHGKGQTAGKLHNDTAYGITGDVDEKGNTIVVRRKPFLSLELRDIPDIRDKTLRDALFDKTRHIQSIHDAKEKKSEFEKALLEFKRNDKTFKGIRRVRLTEALSVIPIKDKQGKIYKGFKGDSNYRFDVWETLDNKWQAEVVSTFDIHQPDWQSTFHIQNPTARRVLRLQQNDMVAYDHPDTGHTIARVVKFAANGRIFFAPHNETGNLKQRDSDKNDPFKYFSKSATGLKDIRCRQVRIDETGKVFDPGPQDRQSREARAY